MVGSSGQWSATGAPAANTHSGPCSAPSSVCSRSIRWLPLFSTPLLYVPTIERKVPHSPAASSSARRQMSGAQRRVWFTASGMPAASQRATRRSLCASVGVSGFSQKTRRGCSASTSSNCTACSAVGEHRLTTSKGPAAAATGTLSKPCVTPQRRMNAARRSASGSTHAAISKPPCRRYAPACVSGGKVGGRAASKPPAIWPQPTMSTRCSMAVALQVVRPWRTRTPRPRWRGRRSAGRSCAPADARAEPLRR